MSTALQKLNFVVSMIDKVSAPAGKMMKNMDTVTTRIQSGYQKIGYGAAGVAGAGYALNRLLTPAKELDRALGEVKSLDVADSVLNKLTKSSLNFSMAYGESATDFVRSSYDIQSAINGLVGNELATFTEASAILAKGTKADTATITSYVGTMYGIFKTNADTMGKGVWVKQLAGQTAAAVQMFKTTGSEMSSSFSRVGAAGVSMGIAMNEQVAILGTLQASMTGSEAGTKYTAFLDGVGKAQKKLGLSFTDSQGKMLPMVQILERIKGKFGDINTTAKYDVIKEAFGRKEAVGLIQLLSKDIGGLNKNIGLIGKQKGMDKAIAMANAMKDPWDVAGQQLNAVMIVLGKAMIPALLPFLSAMGEGAKGILRWTNLFPNLTRWVGFGILGLFGLITAFSALSIAVGISKFVMVGWGVAFSTLKIAFIAMKFSLLTVIPAVWGFTAALLANPMTWMAIVIGGLIALIVDATGGWRAWTAAIVDFGKAIADIFNSFTEDPFAFIGNSIDWLIDKINLIPDIDINTSTQAPKPIAGPAGLNSNAPRGGQGGVINQITNANNANSNRSIGDVHVNNYGQAMNGQSLRDELEFAAG